MFVVLLLVFHIGSFVREKDFNRGLVVWFVVAAVIGLLQPVLPDLWG